MLRPNQQVNPIAATPSHNFPELSGRSGKCHNGYKAPLPDPLYVYCAKIFSHCDRVRAHSKPSIHNFPFFEEGLQLRPVPQTARLTFAYADYQDRCRALTYRCDSLARLEALERRKPQQIWTGRFAT